MLKINDQITLRSPEAKDTESMYQYRNDPDIISALEGFSRGFSRKDMLEWVEQQRNRKNDHIWVIADADDQCIGHCGLYKIDSDAGTADIAVCIGNAAFRKGQSRAIMKAVVNYAFVGLKLRKIKAEVLNTNKLSINFTKKFGFKEECVLREQEYRNGLYVDMHIFGLFQCDWNPDAVRCLPA